MLERLDNYDWKEAFGYAGEPDTNADANHDVAKVLGSNVPESPFSREDVAEIVAIEDGENDEESWLGVFKLKDGRYAMVEAGCCYTGWDVQAWGEARVAETLNQIVRLALTERGRERLKLHY
jgi:hypothetical protein